MPLFIQPVLRALQEAEEAEGLIKKIDSQAVVIKKIAEAAVIVIKPVPVQQTRVLRGTVYKAS